MSKQSRKTRRLTPRRQGFVLNGVGYVPIAGGGFAYVDEDDFAAISRYNWRWNSKGYAVRGIIRNGRRLRLYMHHVIHPPKKGFEVDHKNRVPHDNRSDNLRDATRSQNRVNRILRPPVSGYRGVHPTRSGAFAAKIKVKRRWKHLGSYSDVRHAALAYDLAAIRYFGQFAVLNLPEVFCSQASGRAASPRGAAA